jgi:hypothetical protein
MSFPYDPTLPNPPDDPADDVAGMQTNASSISQLIAVDHSGFNTSTGGTHMQVTYSSNNPPGTFPVSPPVSFTDLPTNYGGTPTYPQQFFFSGTNFKSLQQYLLTAQGSVLLAGGIILKWGSGTASNAISGNNILFASAFPNTVLGVYAGSSDAGTTSTANTYVYARKVDLTQFNLLVTFRTTTGSPSGGANYFYFAIGN